MREVLQIMSCEEAKLECLDKGKRLNVGIEEELG